MATIEAVKRARESTERAMVAACSKGDVRGSLREAEDDMDRAINMIDDEIDSLNELRREMLFLRDEVMELLAEDDEEMVKGVLEGKLAEN